MRSLPEAILNYSYIQNSGNSCKGRNSKKITATRTYFNNCGLPYVI